MKHVSLIYGIEEFLINKQMKKIIKGVIGTDEKEHYTEYDLMETPISVAIEDCETIPFFEDKKVVVCKNPMFLTGQKSKTSFEHDLEHLIQYILNPTDFSHLILVLNYEKLDTRKKVVKEVRKHANVFEANLMKENEIVETIIKVCKKYDKEISHKNANLIVSKVGNNFSLVYQELKKLITYLGEDEISKEAIDLVVSRTLEENIFDLVDAILNKNKEKAMQIYYDLLDLKEEPIKIIILIANQIRLIYQTKVLFRKGLSEKDAAKKLGVHPYRVKLAYKISNKYADHYLLDLLDELTELDYKIKSSNVNKFAALELFIIKI